MNIKIEATIIRCYHSGCKHKKNGYCQLQAIDIGEAGQCISLRVIG